MMRRAVFLDRDGTLVRPGHYPSRPDELEIYEGVAEELHLVQSSGFALVVVTNQSGIARGLFTDEDLQRMHTSLKRQLAESGVIIDAFYYCPHHPEGIIPVLSIACECRKPEPGMLLTAARELDIDLRRSWFLGDILDDVEAGNRAECRTVLVDLGTESPPVDPVRMPSFVAMDTVHALRMVQAVEGVSEPVDLGYLPLEWSEAVLASVGQEELTRAG